MTFQGRQALPLLNEPRLRVCLCREIVNPTNRRNPLATLSTELAEAVGRARAFRPSEQSRRDPPSVRRGPARLRRLLRPARRFRDAGRSGRRRHVFGDVGGDQERRDDPPADARDRPAQISSAVKAKRSTA
jgi:hypothetical protein